MQTNLTIPTFGDTRLPPRFWAKVCVLDNGCWEWTGARMTNGYGVVWAGEQRGTILVHRWAYECLVGPIPDRLQSDHLCHGADKACGGGRECSHRRCVFPAHLEPVSHLENVRRGLVGQKTRCPQGHPYTGSNLYRGPRGDRRCRKCHREEMHERYWRQKST